MSREVLRKFCDERANEPILEIGPLISPFLEKERYNVYYSDIKNKDDIFAEYKEHTNLGTPEEIYNNIVSIDFVVKDTYTEAVGDMRFSVVFSSHVIEHVNDIIRHLLQLSEIITDNGYVALIIPDKRYCFDCFREVTPFRDALDIYLCDDNCSTARLVFDSVFELNLCNDAAKYWNNEVSFVTTATEDGNYSLAFDMYKRVLNERYVPNVHYWVFSYTSFLGFLRDCLRAKLLPYKLHYSASTQAGSNEFSVILQKDASILSDEEKRKNEIAKIVKLEENENKVMKKDSFEALQAERDALQDEIVRVNNKNNALLASIEVLQTEKEAQYKIFINSKSWKITQPLRKLNSFFRAR